MLKYLALFGFLTAAPEPPKAPPPPVDANVIKDISECNHPALQIGEFKLFSYMSDYYSDFATSKYWKELSNGKIQQVIVVRKDCKSLWQLMHIEVINPYGEKL